MPSNSPLFADFGGSQPSSTACGAMISAHRASAPRGGMTSAGLSFSTSDGRRYASNWTSSAASPDSRMCRTAPCAGDCIVTAPLAFDTSTWTVTLSASLTVTPGLVEFAFSEFYQTPSPLLTSRYCAFVLVHFCSEWYRLFSIVAR